MFEQYVSKSEIKRAAYPFPWGLSLEYAVPLKAVEKLPAAPVVSETKFNEVKAELDKLNKFKAYFDSLYGEGLEIKGWHLNGDLESFDNFYDSAIEAMKSEVL